MNRATVFAEALALSENERLELAAELLASAGPPPGVLTEGTPEFRSELRRRVAQVKSGKAKTIPWAEARGEILQSLADARRVKKVRASKRQRRFAK